MGYIRHHGFLITDWDEVRATETHQEALRLFPATIVSELKKSYVNRYFSFSVFPDGSKEGWHESNDCDGAREKFVKYLNNTSIDWVLVQFAGDDLCDTKIISSKGLTS